MEENILFDYIETLLRLQKARLVVLLRKDVEVQAEIELLDKSEQLIKDLKYKSIKLFTKQAIESVIHNSVSDYDCLIEKLNEMMYPEEFEKGE